MHLTGVVQDRVDPPDDNFQVMNNNETIIIENENNIGEIYFCVRDLGICSDYIKKARM